MGNNSPRVIGITGRKGSGKDHFAKVMTKAWRIKTDQQCRTLSFATPMKQICSIIFREPLHVFYLEESARAAYKTRWKWADLTEELQKAFPQRGEFVTAREAVQLIGYDLFRLHFCGLVWIRMMADELDAQTCKLILIPDVRFEEEADMLRGRGATLIRVVDPHAVIPEGGHKTETKMDAIPVDHTVQNDRKREPYDLEQEASKLVFPA